MYTLHGGFNDTLACQDYYTYSHGLSKLTKVVEPEYLAMNNNDNKLLHDFSWENCGKTGMNKKILHSYVNNSMTSKMLFSSLLLLLLELHRPNILCKIYNFIT